MKTKKYRVIYKKNRDDEPVYFDSKIIDAANKHNALVIFEETYGGYFIEDIEEADDD
jgi:hypothetical protein